MAAIYDVGDAVALRHEVRDADGELATATVALYLMTPDGNTVTPVVAASSVGVYDAAAYVTTQVGVHAYRWEVSGAVTDVARGTFYVAVQAPPAYVTVATVKLMMGKATSGVNDELVAQAARSASRLIDRRTGRRFWADAAPVARTYGTDRAYRDSLGYGLLVDDIADGAGLTATVGGVIVPGLTTWPRNAAAMGMPIVSLRGPVLSSNPWTAEATITARWGWPYVPDEVQQAAGLLAARLYRRKDSPDGVVGSAEWGGMRVGRVDPDVEQLISHLILPGFA